MPLRTLGFVALTAALGCSGAAQRPDDADAGSGIDLIPDGSIDAGPWTRDWIAHPAVVQVPTARRLFAVSDVHGGFDRLLELLTNAGLIAADQSWSGADAVLVVDGDSIDKGVQSVEVLAFWETLEKQANSAGGRVVALLGNHEAAFLSNPSNDKAATLQDELADRGITPDRYASAELDSGRALRSMPIAALVAGWFFCHAGSSGGRTIALLSSTFHDDVERGRWDSELLSGPTSPLERADWWTSATVAADLSALGARHLVMGHDPHAFGEEGLIEAHFGGRLVRIDTGLSPAVDLSHGRLLRVDAPGTAGETAWSVSHKGVVTALDLAGP